MLPMPRFTFGSRNHTGSSCAWQSVMCSSDTLPKRGTSYSASAAVAASAWAHRPSAMPATEAAPMTCRKSRLDRFIS